jgi:hypothetical protein
MNLNKLWFLMPVVLLLFFACNTRGETDGEREKFQQQLESRFATLEQQIQDTRDRATDLSGDDRTKVDESIAKLDEQRSILASKLGAMKEAGDDEWEVVKAELQEASKDLDQSFLNLQEAIKLADSSEN